MLLNSTVSLAHYEILETVYESSYSLVCRARDRQADQVVILKILNQAYPDPKASAWFEREYQILQVLQSANRIVDAFAYSTDQHQPFMVLEDIGGRSLDRYLQKGSFSVPEFLQIAVQAAEALGQVHQHQVIHRDISPNNIVYDRPNRRIGLIDFGIASQLTSETLNIGSPGLLQGNLFYMAPEQTGRMNRVVDYRADFYALGSTFYHMLVGRPPFQFDDSLEMVHAHIAIQPDSPHELLPEEVPQVVSDIVMKLMSKSAEDRYYSAAGLQADLQDCLWQWHAEDRIAYFEVGRKDLPTRFQIPQKLYGRETDIANLMAAFGRASGGTAELLLVSGYSGVGKSAVIQELYKPVTEKRGFFVGGKFDQLQQKTPYSAFWQALEDLAQLLLGEPENEVRRWRMRLRMALGANGRVITDNVPGFRLLLGTFDPLPELSPNESRNRFQHTIQRFVAEFCDVNHPLVLYLDDMQWADLASIYLLAELLGGDQNKHLLVVGVYRDNEVAADHPLLRTVDKLREQQIVVSNIRLDPLSVDQTALLLCDMLHCTADEAQPLSELVSAKCGGNPFFTIEFLKELQAEKLIGYDHLSSRWRWSLSKIQAKGITDNVVELMMGRVQRLGEQTAVVLKLAACIGNQFDLRTLSIVYQHDMRQTAEALWESIITGVVLPQGEDYKLVMLDLDEAASAINVVYRFAHDRLQQAVYNLIPDSGRRAIHWQIGQLLYRTTHDSDRHSRIFELADHFNKGYDNERVPVSQLAFLQDINLQATVTAKGNNAFAIALHYAQYGVDYATHSGGWKNNYKDTLQIFNLAAQTALLNGDFDYSERCVSEILEYAIELPDRANAQEVRIDAAIARNDFMGAIAFAREALIEFGITFPDDPTAEDLEMANRNVLALLPTDGISTLGDQALMQDEETLAIMQLLQVFVSTATYIVAPRLFVLGTLQAVELSIVHGIASLSAFTYVLYGMILSIQFNESDLGYQFGHLAVRLAEMVSGRKYRGRIWHVFNTFIRPWKDLPRQFLPDLLEAYRMGVESGDTRFAPQSLTLYSIFSLKSGTVKLPGLLDQMIDFRHEIQRFQEPVFADMLDIYVQVAANLTGESSNPLDLNGRYYDADARVKIYKETKNANSLDNYYGQIVFLGYLFNDYDRASEAIELNRPYRNVSFRSWGVTHRHYFENLTMLAQFDELLPDEKEAALSRIQVNMAELAEWASYSPESHGHYYRLVLAEWARVTGDRMAAREYYDEAVLMAQQHESLRDEALAHERAAYFYQDIGYHHLFVNYLRQSHYVYRQWGADGKVAQLQRNFPNIFAGTLSPTAEYQPDSTIGIPSSSIAEALDLSSILRASQTISSEIVLDRLLSTMIGLAMENAGATRGLMLLSHKGEWQIEVEGEVNAEGVAVQIENLMELPLSTRLPEAAVNYAIRTRETLVLTDAQVATQFKQDAYIASNHVRSLLAMPLLNRGEISAVLYLENNLTSGAFTQERLEPLYMLSSQAAVALDNARLYEEVSQVNQQLEAYSHNLEDMVASRTQELEQAVAELDAFAHTVAHDLKGPLGAVIGYAEMVAEYLDDMPKSEILDLIRNVEKGGLRMRDIIDGLLTLAKTRDGNLVRRPLDMLVVVKEVQDRYDYLLTEHSAEIVSPDQWPTAIGHAALVEEVWANYLSNAIKYGGRPLRIELGWDKLENDQVRFWVKDNGDGLLPEQQARIFMPFTRLQHRSDSHGLGLSIVERIVTRLQGTVGVESEVGVGSRFYFTLPSRLL